MDQEVIKDNEEVSQEPEVLVHRDEYQVALDVNRSFVQLPMGKYLSLNYRSIQVLRTAYRRSPTEEANPT